jgi:hypothetical protein
MSVGDAVHATVLFAAAQALTAPQLVGPPPVEFQDSWMFWRILENFVYKFSVLVFNGFNGF